MPSRFDDPIHEEIREFIRRLNACWTRGNARDLVDFFHPRMLAVTPFDPQPLGGAAACLQSWQAFAAAATIDRWQENDMRIELYGDNRCRVAVVAYVYDIAFHRDGRNYEEKGRDLYFLIQENGHHGRWRAIADQFSSLPEPKRA